MLCQLADSGSVSKAAAALGISQPALTAQLRRVETALGGRLFERSPHGVTPTPFGLHVLARARTIITDMDDLAGFQRRLDRAAQPLRIGSARTVLFGGWLTRLESAFPGRQVETTLDTSIAVVNDLLAAKHLDIIAIGRYDSVHAVPCPAGALERTVVYPEPLLIALPEHHRLAGEVEVKLEDLAEESWISPPGGRDGDQAAFRDVCEAYGFTPQFRFSNMESADIEQLLVSGRAVALAAATVRPMPGMVTRPIRGQPLVWRRVLRWMPELLGEDEVDLVHQTFIDAYRSTLDQHASNQQWWTSSPQTHPTVVPPGRKAL